MYHFIHSSFSVDNVDKLVNNHFSRFFYTLNLCISTFYMWIYAFFIVTVL